MVHAGPDVRPRQPVVSRLAVPFIVGLPGFRAKTWLDDAVTGACHGIYQWDTVEAAERYAGSFAIHFMTRRSRPGSVHYQITPGDTVVGENDE